jgi:hypothetical protein
MFFSLVHISFRPLARHSRSCGIGTAVHDASVNLACSFGGIPSLLSYLPVLDNSPTLTAALFSAALTKSKMPYPPPEKASHEEIIQIPAKLEVLANGVLRR